MKKRNTSNPPGNPAVRPAATGQRFDLDATVAAADPRFPWALGIIYLLVLGYFTFRYHHIGGFGVETDFYAELVPQARRLLDGRFSPLNYGAKGPVYSFLLTGVYLVVRDLFTAGLVINLLSAGAFLAALYFLVRRVFSPLAAQLVTLAAACNPVFQSYTWQAGSDLPFMAFCALAMLFLFRDDGRRDIVLSAVFGLLAFLTRYNGAFIPLGAAVYYALTGVGWRGRLKRLGLWFGVFTVAGLPWFIPNWLATGSPVHNDNYMNVMLEFYALRMGAAYENWQRALPKQFTGLGDIILYDPVYFIRRMAANAVDHFRLDLGDLVGWRLGVFTVAGIPLMFAVRAGLKRAVYFSFGLFYFLILTLVFYNTRFSLYLLAFYLPLAVWPFTAKPIVSRLGRAAMLPAAVLLAVIATYGWTSTRATIAEITTPQEYLGLLKDMGEAVKRDGAQPTDILAARKPHAAYFAGTEYRMFPDAATIPELISKCRDLGIDYIVYSGVEASQWPQLDGLVDLNAEFNGLKLVYYNRFGVVYAVEDGG